MVQIKADIRKVLDYYLALTVEALAQPPAEEGGDPIPFGGKAFVQPGGEVAWDQCDCDGQAWSRFVSATPVYGTRKASGEQCVVRWDLTLAVGVLRCVAGPTNRGGLPTGEQITSDGHKFADDLLALMTAVECDTTTYALTVAAPLGPQGGCAGSEVQFIVRMSPCCP